MSSPTPTQLGALCTAFVQPDEKTVDEAAAGAAITQIILVLHGRRATLKDVVVECGAYLTSEDSHPRRRGVLLLSELLTRLPTLPLDEQARQTFLTFFTERLKDEACWKETLLGLSSLVHHRSLAGSQLVAICRAIFDHVAVQSLTQSGRKLALDILYAITQTQARALVELGEYTISGLIRCIDGEKDPRNLLITFRLARFILAGGDDGTTRGTFPTALLTPYIEELFEVTSCYFPITFHPPKNDPIGITGADLQNALRDVFSSHAGLAEFVMPMLLEKIESTSVECKLDVIATLRHCIRSGAYGIPQWDPFLVAVQRALKKEMFHGGSEQEAVIAAASTAFSDLVAMLCPDEVGGFAAGHLAPSWSLLMGPLLDEIAAELQMPDSKMARAYATMLQLICATTVNACARAMQHLFRDTIEAKFYSSHVQPTQRVALIDLMRLIIAAVNQRFERPMTQHPLQPYAETMVEMMASVLMDGSAEQRATALQGMADIATLPPFTRVQTNDHATSGSADTTTQCRLLPLEQVRSLVQTLTDRLHTDASADVRHHCLTGLVQLSRDATYSPLLLQFTLPVLFNARTKALLPTDAATIAASASAAPAVSDLDRLGAAPRAASLEDVLDAASALCRSSSLLVDTLPHLLQMVQTHFIGALQGQSASVHAIHMVLGCLSEIVSSLVSTEDGRARLACCVSSLPHALVGLLVSGSLLITKASTQFALDAKVISTAVTILQTVTRTADVAAQQIIVDQIIRLFLDADVTVYKQAMSAATADVAFTPLIMVDPSLVAQTARSQLQLVPLFTAVIGSYRSGVQLPRIAEVIQRLGWFIDAHADAASSVARQSAIECLAAILNKLPVSEPIFNEFVDQHLDQTLMRQIYDDQTDSDRRLLAVNVMIWSTKALVMRGHPRGAQFAAKLIQALALYPSAPALAEAIARGMSILLQDCTTVLNRDAHANCGPGQLYKQRFFVQNFPLLLSLFESSAPSSSDPHSPRFVVLLAVAHLLKHVPHVVIMSSLQTLIPLLMQSLTHTEPELRVATIDTVAVLLGANVHCMERHLSTLVPVLIDLMTHTHATRVRLTALSCLSYLRGLPYEQLHPFRSRILLALGESVDDRKRVVRQAAAKARNQWCLMTE